MRKSIGALLLGALTLPTAMAANETPLQVETAWVRALPPTQSNTAGYLTITNSGDESVTITGGSSEIAEAVEIHTTREVDGLLRMQELTEITVEPGETVELAPGGMHLMLLGLKRMPAEGEEVALCLDVQDAPQQCVTAKAMKRADSGHSNHTHH
ncbi:MAG: copper chaperone PCu(A)C [Pseudomonadota bacterium]